MWIDLEDAVRIYAGAVSRRGRMSRCLRVLGVGFLVLGFTLLRVFLVVTARQLELRKCGHV